VKTNTSMSASSKLVAILIICEMPAIQTLVIWNI